MQPLKFLLEVRFIAVLGLAVFEQRTRAQEELLASFEVAIPGAIVPGFAELAVVDSAFYERVLVLIAIGLFEVLHSGLLVLPDASILLAVPVRLIGFFVLRGWRDFLRHLLFN